MIVRSWRTLLASIPKDVPSTCSPASMRPVQRYLESVSKFTNNFTQYRIFRISSVPCDPNGNTTMTSAWFVWIHRLKSMIIRIMRRRTELWPKLVSVCQKQRVAPDEQKRILRILALVLFIYTVLFLPSIVKNTIFALSIVQVQKTDFDYLHAVSGILLYLNPFADCLLYVFLRKDINNMLRCSCCKA